MEPTIKAEGETNKRHSRQVSYNRAPLARRATRGPLDIDDPLSPLPVPPPKDTSKPVLSPVQPSPSITSPLSPNASLISLEEPIKDFTYLLQPEIYHPLSQIDVSLSFRTSPNAPAPDTTLPSLLSHGHFRAAASLAASLLTTPPLPTKPEDIFSLLYVRLACLTLINATALATQEARALDDLSSPFYRHPVTNAHLVPWELRVLAVRLQGLGTGDGKKVISGYYELGKDARAEAKKVKGTERDSWKGRLRDLGVRVASGLVEMGDLSGAGRHLKSLAEADMGAGEDPTMRGRLGLLYLKIGDLETARRYIKSSSDDDDQDASTHSAVLNPLLCMAEGDYDGATTQLTALRNAGGTPDPTVLQNLAVCLIYSGKLIEARPILESLVTAGQSFDTLLVNLSTVYELCTEKARGLKMDLAGKVAAKEGSGVGWEKTNAIFKL